MSTSHRTKIVCTVGPATEDDNVLRALIKSGMNVARLNFSHGSHEYHRANIERVRRIARELGTFVAIMVDTKGPEIRTGLTRNHQPLAFARGDQVVVTTRPVEGTHECISIDYQLLPQEVAPGALIYMDDGLLGLEVERVEGCDIHCRLTNDGMLGERKGVNVPNVIMQLPAVTEQDREDIRFSCEMGVDAVAASFVRNGAAVREIRALCASYGQPNMMIISKIESSLALDSFDEILHESDGIMVARGDLGIEIPPAEVPQVQKSIIARCNAAYKPVITATQMLDSMTRNPRPTRAEVTDVANAIYDGTDCVMLSGETAVGSYPVETVKMMAEICTHTEQELPSRHVFHTLDSSRNVNNAAALGAIEMAERVGAKALLCPTESGGTARLMSAFRPQLPIIATSPYESTLRHTCFYWGVEGILTTVQDGLAPICYDTLKMARNKGLVKTDGLVVITAGDPVTSPLTRNTETSTNVCMIAQVF